MKNCTTCYWWTDNNGCRNTNWTSGSRTDPEVPVCGLLTPTSGAPMSWRPKMQERVLHPQIVSRLNEMSETKSLVVMHDIIAKALRDFCVTHPDTPETLTAQEQEALEACYDNNSLDLYHMYAKIMFGEPTDQIKAWIIKKFDLKELLMDNPCDNDLDFLIKMFGRTL